MSQIYKRKALFVDPQMQSEFMIKFAAIVISAVAVIGVTVFLLVGDSTTVVIENTKIQARTTADFILPILAVTVAVVSAAAAAVMAVMALFVSHRIAGPIVRFKQEIDLLKEGQMNRNFSTREKDRLKDLADCLQEMSDTLKLRQTRLKKSCAELADVLKQADYSPGQADKERLRKLVAELENSADYFKT